jgi:hypothetical protein
MTSASLNAFHAAFAPRSCAAAGSEIAGTSANNINEKAISRRM